MKDQRLYVGHILEAIRRIESYTSEGKEAFFADTMSQDAVVMNVQIIGEAAKKMSDELKKQYSKIPWRDVMGMRDKIVHDYAGIKLEVVWDVVQNGLPSLKQVVESMMQKLGGEIH